MEHRDLNVVIVGLGLIGGCFAKAIRKNVTVKNIWAIDVNDDVLLDAEKQNVIDRGFLLNSHNIEGVLKDTDLVVICTYPHDTVKFVRDNMKSFKVGAILTDVAGIKVDLMRKIDSVLRDDIEFIGGHPMAGKEVKGFQNSNEKIFNGAQYIIVPSRNSKEENVNLLKSLLLKMKFQDIIELSPSEHDEMVAFTSQLPHAIACTLMNNKMINKSSLCVGGSFRDATRVAKINCDLWSELFLQNKKYIVQELKSFISDLEEFTVIIDTEDKKNLKEKLCKSENIRREID